MPEARCLIDTSVWIDYLRPGCPAALLARVRDILMERRAVSLPVIWLELLTGVLSEALYEDLRDEVTAIPLLEMDERLWEGAYRLGFELRSKGLTIPSVDLIIASAAIRHQVMLLQRDRHFDLIARHSKLKTQHL